MLPKEHLTCIDQSRFYMDYSRIYKINLINTLKQDFLKLNFSVHNSIQLSDVILGTKHYTKLRIAVLSGEQFHICEDQFEEVAGDCMACARVRERMVKGRACYVCNLVDRQKITIHYAKCGHSVHVSHNIKECPCEYGNQERSKVFN